MMTRMNAQCSWEATTLQGTPGEGGYKRVKKKRPTKDRENRTIVTLYPGCYLISKTTLNVD